MALSSARCDGETMSATADLLAASAALFAAAFSAAFIFAIAAVLAAARFAAFFLLSEALDLLLAAAILAFDAVLICFEVLLDLVGPLSDLPTVSLGGIMLLLILLRARLL